ncbi:alpha/beta fold hydrolase [Pseudooceanicola onchidii]|uniref:alpha/beta fold hydrolase n=1 Tax=Pseudooceanicola onchidii TaxID=2562279 RepID=UPI0010AA518A|nr:alpha/beta fold hydrolase [Pseudooceanicola onchidii]
MLNMIRHDGPAGTTPLVIAHGLFGSAKNFAGVARKLSETRTVVCVDMRNHGDSPWTDTHSYPDLAGDLAEVVQSLGTADLMGHSMGGKSSMVMALTRPEGLRRLVIADIAPVAYDHSQTDKIDAMEAVDLSAVTRRSDVTARLQELGVSAGYAGFFTQSFDLAEKRWRFNLRTLRAEMDKLVGFPQVEGRFDGPALFLSGGDSDYVLPEHRDRIKTLFPNAYMAKLPRAGHLLHGDRPEAFLTAVQTFLDAPDRQAS